MAEPTPVRRGNDIYLEVEVEDHTRRPYRLIDPDGGVFYTLRDPDGNVILNAVAMDSPRKGVYSIRYQSNGASPLGIWTGDVRTVHDGFTGLSNVYEAFELTAE
jgi:hypothetical protein